MDIGNDATYLVRGVGSISFHTSLGDVLELSVILFVLGLKKNILSIYFMTNVKWRVSFEGQQCIINYYSLSSLHTLARMVRDSDLYMLLADSLACVYASERLDESSSFKEAQDHVGELIYLVRESIHPRRYASHI